jgi:hypothetical protein
MAQQGPLPYLLVSGVEVSNAARTLSYLRNGLGFPGHWELGPGDVCGVLYRPPGTSGCTRTVYASPAADPAPWYDPTEPGAATFLGLHLLDIDGYDGVAYRAVTNRLGGLGGATFSRQHRNPRAWKFRGALISRDDAGAEYGLRWLESALQASDCADCALGSLTVRLVCPPDDCSNEHLGMWSSYEVALTAGPTEVDKGAVHRSEMQDVLGDCRDFVIVEFTLTAGNPFLYKPPVLCLQATLSQNLVCTDICAFLFGSSGNAVCCTVTPPTRGVLGSIITLQSAGGMGDLLLQAYDGCPGTGGSSGSGSGGGSTLVSQIEISGVPANSTVIIDSSLHSITIIDQFGNASDGSGLVVLAQDEGIQWLEVRDCDDVTCFCVSPSIPCASGSVNVTIQTQEREG